MTLVLACVNAEQVVQVSDRMISAGGKPVSKEMSKATVLTCSDARVTVGYAGLATAPRFIARDQLAEMLLEVAPPTYQIQDITLGLRDRLTYQFKQLRVDPVNRRFSVLISGFRYVDSGPQFLAAVLSNYQDFSSEGEAAAYLPTALPEFQSMFRTSSPGEGLARVFRVGQTDAVADEDFADLNRMLHEMAPPQAIASRAATAIRRARGVFFTGTIGEDVMAASVPVDPEKPVFGQYLPATAQATSYGVDQVMAIPGAAYAVNRMELHAENGSPVAVPIVGRNRPCPCGSPFRYKQCHGNWGKGPGFFWWSQQST
jgi:hypothetical protein